MECICDYIVVGTVHCKCMTMKMMMVMVMTVSGKALELFARGKSNVIPRQTMWSKSRPVLNLKVEVD